jgi:uncharacterized membrane protein YhfC
LAQDYYEWLEQNADRLLAGQKAEADTAKLLATFTAGVAATLVATALQVGTPANSADRWAVSLLALSIAAALFVVFSDRVQSPDHSKVLQNRALSKPEWTDEQTLNELRKEQLATVGFNRWVLLVIRLMLAIQVLLAVTAGAFASASLLSPSGG